MSAPCKHENFRAFVSVGRLVRDAPKPMAFTADVNIQCADCGEPFQFLGLPAGLNVEGAAVSVDGLEARLAICPQSAAPTPLDTIFTKTSTAH